MTYEKLIQEMDAKLQFPGLSNTWTMPVENRLDMELTGIKTPLGMKIQGPSLDGIQQAGAQVQRILSTLPRRAVCFCRACIAGLLRQRRSEPRRSGPVWPDRRGRAAGRHFRHRRQEHRRKHRGPPALSDQRPVQPGFPRQRRGVTPRPDCDASRRADPDRRGGHDFVFARTRP